MYRLLLLLLISFQALAGSFAKYDVYTWTHWADIDQDCQDTRQEILIIKSLKPVTYEPVGSGECIVESGLWLDPYTGQKYSKASDVSIDHIYPLRLAHAFGGHRWGPVMKRLFANDIDNLVVVGRQIDLQKGDEFPREWMPPRKEFHCEYIRRFTHIMNKYQLSHQRKQLDFMRLFKDCFIMPTYNLVDIH